jgi:hypothetical protein
MTFVHFVNCTFVREWPGTWNPYHNATSEWMSGLDDDYIETGQP